MRRRVVGVVVDEAIGRSDGDNARILGLSGGFVRADIELQVSIKIDIGGGLRHGVVAGRDAGTDFEAA